MNQSILYVGLDVDDTQYHGSALSQATGEVLHFQCYGDSAMFRSRALKLLFLLFIIVPTVASGYSTQKHNSETMVADLFYDRGKSNLKPIILLPGSEGGKAWSKRKKIIKKLVEKDFAVLSLTYHRMNHLPKNLVRIPVVEYINNAIKFMKELDFTSDGEVTLLGISRGGELGLLIASLNQNVGAVVALVPSAYVVPGFDPNRKKGLPMSGWSLKGEEIPYIQWAGMTLVQAVEQTSDNEKEAARIKVENINGPILCISGKKDKLWDSTYMCNLIQKQLQISGYGHPYKHVVIDGSGHYVTRSSKTWKNVYEFLDGALQ